MKCFCACADNTALMDRQIKIHPMIDFPMRKNLALTGSEIVKNAPLQFIRIPIINADLGK